MEEEEEEEEGWRLARERWRCCQACEEEGALLLRPSPPSLPTILYTQPLHMYHTTTT